MQQVVSNPSFASYLGYVRFSGDGRGELRPYASYIQPEIITLFLFVLSLLCREWKSILMQRYPHYPSQEYYWPCFPLLGEKRSPTPAVGTTTRFSPLTPSPLNSLENSRISADDASYLANTVPQHIRELLIMFNYWISNIFTITGFEICILMHLVAAVALMDVVAVVYLGCMGVLMAVGREQAASLWGVLTVCDF